MRDRRNYGNIGTDERRYGSLFRHFPNDAMFTFENGVYTVTNEEKVHEWLTKMTTDTESEVSLTVPTENEGNLYSCVVQTGKIQIGDGIPVTSIDDVLLKLRDSPDANYSLDLTSVYAKLFYDDLSPTDRLNVQTKVNELKVWHWQLPFVKNLLDIITELQVSHPTSPGLHPIHEWTVDKTEQMHLVGGLYPYTKTTLRRSDPDKFVKIDLVTRLQTLEDSAALILNKVQKLKDTNTNKNGDTLAGTFLASETAINSLDVAYYSLEQALDSMPCPKDTLRE